MGSLAVSTASWLCGVGGASAALPSRGLGREEASVGKKMEEVGLMNSSFFGKRMFTPAICFGFQVFSTIHHVTVMSRLIMSDAFMGTFLNL